jgi:hypothetical protein
MLIVDIIAHLYFGTYVAYIENIIVSYRTKKTYEYPVFFISNLSEKTNCLDYPIIQ